MPILCYNVPMHKRVSITGLAFGGSGVGRIYDTETDKGKVVFVPLTVPGDEAVIDITSEKKTFCEGALKELIKAGAERVEPACRWYGACGGCSWGHIRYSGQVAWKGRILKETLERIGRIKTDDILFDAPAQSPDAYNYRSRARFHCAEGRIGFYGAKSHEIVPVDACPLLDGRINAAYIEVRDILTHSGMKAVESIEIGVGEDGPAAAVFHIHGSACQTLGKALARADSHKLKGFEIRASSSGRVLLTHGDVLLAGRVAGMEIISGVSVFSQANQVQNKTLVDMVVDYAKLGGTERALDLYCGCGNLSLPLAAHAGFVTGVEAQAASVEYAVANATRNGVTNTVFHRASVARWLEKNVKALERDGADVIILDPPRDGEPEAVKIIARLRPSRIIYVSCNPPALGRDAGFLERNGYRLTRIGLVDMFPQTYHIESIVRLDRV